jgi:phosphoribosylformylglycinamidine cyclo-ligase
VFRKDAWKPHPVFREIQRRGNVPEKEMWRTFNMGLGMVMVIRPDSLDAARRALPEARVVGEIREGKHEVRIV